MSVTQQPRVRPGTQRTFVSFNENDIHSADLRRLLRQLREDLSTLFSFSEDDAIVKTRDTLSRREQDLVCESGDTHYVDIHVGPLRNAPGEEPGDAFQKIVQTFSDGLTSAQRDFKARLF